MEMRYVVKAQRFGRIKRQKEFDCFFCATNMARKEMTDDENDKVSIWVSNHPECPGVIVFEHDLRLPCEIAADQQCGVEQ